jgi:4-diphosphocytidyl-2-C-methyl-D-erythritol kinase
MTGALTLKAPAKLNFRLDVLRRRPDGYHELRMVMQRINLCDHIRISLLNNPGIKVLSSSKEIPEGHDNIVWKAADALLKRAGRHTGVEISITKNIPVAAGLGGGSSDCATTLMGLNSLLELGLDDSSLMKIGLNLGADVPFFIFGKPAVAEGVGEILTEIEEMPKLWLALVNPGIQVSTAWVYGNLGLTTEKVADKIPVLYKSATDIANLLSNDLEAVTISRFPIIRKIKELLMASGASGTLMSGSGPTVFGVFRDEPAARNAATTLAGSSNWFTAAVETI